MVQLLPGDDAFTENATHYGQRLAGYLRLRPWTSDAATGYAIPTAVGHLHAGYFNILGGALSAASATPAAFTSAASGASTGHLCSALWRPYYAARCKATLALSCAVTIGTYADTFRYAGVTVRNTGGTYDDTAGVEALSADSGYWFVLAQDAGAGGAKWLLLRVNTGTITVLAQSAAFTLSANQASKLLVMDLQVADASGNVSLTATYQFQGSATPVGGFTTTNPFGGAIIDSSGSKLTAAGRCGFGMSRERVQTGPTIRSATVASYFQIYDSDSTAYVLVDEWQRVALAGCTAVSGELNGKNGRMLSSMWGDDVAGTNTLKAKRDAGNNRIALDTAGFYGMWSQRPASHQATQHRTVTLNFVTSANQRYAGILLRGTNLHDVLSRACYHAQLLRTGAGAWECRIYDERIGYTALAVKTGLSLSDATDIDLEFEIENSGGVDDLTGEVHMVVRIDGVVVSGWSGAPAGVVIQSSGLVIDQRSARILTGFMEGLEATLTTSTEKLYLDAWLEPTSVFDESDENAQDSIAVSDELDGITGTLVLPIDWNVNLRKRARRARHVMCSRHVGRIALDRTMRRRWRVRSKTATPSEKATLLAFFDGHRGVEVPFYWAEPRRAETVPVAFIDKRLADTLRAPNVVDFSFELEERLSPS